MFKDKILLSISAVLILYFLAIFANFISHSVFEYYADRDWEYNYKKFIFPYFKQPWDMYSNPPKRSSEIYYQVKGLDQSGEKVELGWKKILFPMYEVKKNKYQSSTTVSDFTYLLWNSINNVVGNVNVCLQENSYFDSCDDDVYAECTKDYYKGDSIIVEYLKRFQVVQDIQGIEDSIKVEFKIVLEPIPLYGDTAKRKKVVLNRPPFSFDKS